MNCSSSLSGQFKISPAASIAFALKPQSSPVFANGLAICVLSFISHTISSPVLLRSAPEVRILQWTGLRDYLLYADSVLICERHVHWLPHCHLWSAPESMPQTFSYAC